VGVAGRALVRPSATHQARATRGWGRIRTVWGAARSGWVGRYGVLLGGAALFAAIFLIRMLDGNQDDLVSLLYVLPVALLASRGVAAGLAGAAIGAGLTLIWGVTEEPDVSAVGYVTRLAVIVFVAIVVGIGADRLRHALREREEVLERLREQGRHFNLSRDLLCTATPDGYFDRLNDRWEQLLGWTKAELRARPFIEFVHPDDREATAAESAGLARGEDTVEFMNRYATKDGDWVWLEWSAGTAPDTDRIYAAARDVTERQRAEAARGRLAAIVEHSTDAILTVSPQGEITTWNPAAERLFGYPADEAIGRPVSMLAPAGPADEVVRRLDGVRDAGTVGHLEECWVRRDGEPLDLVITLSYVPGAYGEAEGASLIARDVTEETRAREEIEQAKQEFFGSVSHELRTPLTSIIAYSELLAEEAGGLSEPGRKAVEVIERNAHRQLRLVGDMLLVTRIQEERFSLVRETMSLATVVEDAVEAVGPWAQAAGLELHLQAGDLPEIDGDPGRLGQAVDNLLSNAIKYTPAGGRIDVRVIGRGESAVVEVEDSGLGIPEAELDRLFERMFRASSTHRIQGIGIGLSIVKAITEAHGGSVKVASQEGVGTTFTLEIPIGGTAMAEEARAEKEGAA
jgi:PAS domain S-box-containing protein